MKGLLAKDLRGNDPAELRSTMRKLEEDLFKNRLKKNTNQLENTALIRKRAPRHRARQHRPHRASAQLRQAPAAAKEKAK